MAKYWIQRLSEERIREKGAEKVGWASRALGLKILTNATSYGVFVEVNVQRESGEMEVCGLDAEETFMEAGSKVEEAGDLFCPLLGVTIASGSHLLLALLDTVTSSFGGEVVYQDTDSAFVTPAKIAPSVAAKFDSLNPYSEPCAFLKDETYDKLNPKLKDGSRLPMPKAVRETTLRFFGLSSKRYCLFVRDRHGRAVVRTASDHGLGMYQVPKDREGFIRRVWESVIRATEEGEEAGEGFSPFPATAEFALTTPALWPRVSNIEGMKPFSFMTIQYKDPAALQEGVEAFELLPYISPKEAAWPALADKDGARNWEHVVSEHSHPPNRKYLPGPEGRIIRREVSVRGSSIFGLGKEGAKLALRLKLGKAGGASPAVFVDWKHRLLAMGRTECRRLGLPYRNVKRWKARLRSGRPLRSDALARLKRALLAGPLLPEAPLAAQLPRLGRADHYGRAGGDLGDRVEAGGPRAAALAPASRRDGVFST
jgi:hypothetical protein